MNFRQSNHDRKIHHYTVTLNPCNLKGNQWREMRKILSPAFTCSKMKQMSQLIIDCADRFTEFVAEESGTGREYELREIFRRYTNDVVATCNYGIAVDSVRDPTNDFYIHGKDVSISSKIAALTLVIGNQFPTLMKLLRLRLFTERVRTYFAELVRDTVTTRQEKGIYRPDMIQLMMDMRDDNGKGLSLDEMTSQAFNFFLGGFHTSSLLVSFAAHEIAVNPEVQTKLLAEVEKINRKTNGKPDYDAFNEMPYMDAVLDETNRLYMGPPFLDRLCVKEFELPPAGPGLKPVTVNPGEVVWFLPGSIHRDPQYFQDPKVFKPERFLNDEVSPSHYMAFGVGPRYCIGKRFGQLQIKILLFYVLQRCKLEPSSKTTIPIEYDPEDILASSKGGFWLNFKAREGYTCANGGVEKARNGKVSAN